MDGNGGDTDLRRSLKGMKLVLSPRQRAGGEAEEHRVWDCPLTPAGAGKQAGGG